MKKSILISVLAALLFASSVSCAAAYASKSFPHQKASDAAKSDPATSADATPGDATPGSATPSDAAQETASWQLCAPDEITVYVDGSVSFEVSVLDANRKEVALDPERQRLTAECDGSTARAEVEGQTVYLIGVQNGTTDLILYLQEKNEEGEFEEVSVQTDGHKTAVSAVVAVTAN